MIRDLMEHLGLTYQEAADFLNRHLGTRYPPHRLKEWAGHHGYIRRQPPQNVVDFIKERMK